MNPKVIAILKGGLGNQLFTYAAARSFALRSDRELWIDDTSGFTRDGYGRSCRLDRFPITARPAPDDLRLGDPRGFRHRSTRALNKLLPTRWRSYFPEKAGSLRDFASRRRVVHLNGYWQDETAFKDHAATIRHELAPPATSSPLEEELPASDSVFIHVRRVRYTPRLDAAYYEAAIRLAAEAMPHCRFEVFGDDLDWAHQHLGFASRPVRFHRSGGEDELHDFRLMTLCRHAIVANSSFSWWAAWLVDSPDKRVWTPADPGWPVKAAQGWTPVANGLEQ